ncbi:hypothetical protein DIPPA_31715, partial [Diplonema papillatum]
MAAKAGLEGLGEAAQQLLKDCQRDGMPVDEALMSELRCITVKQMAHVYELLDAERVKNAAATTADALRAWCEERRGATVSWKEESPTRRTRAAKEHKAQRQLGEAARTRNPVEELKGVAEDLEKHKARQSAVDAAATRVRASRAVQRACEREAIKEAASGERFMGLPDVSLAVVRSAFYNAASVTEAADNDEKTADAEWWKATRYRLGYQSDFVDRRSRRRSSSLLNKSKTISSMASDSLDLSCTADNVLQNTFGTLNSLAGTYDGQTRAKPSWNAVVEFAPIPASSAETASREEYYRGYLWWQAPKYIREWEMSGEATFWMRVASVLRTGGADDGRRALSSPPPPPPASSPPPAISEIPPKFGPGPASSSATSTTTTTTTTTTITTAATTPTNTTAAAPGAATPSAATCSTAPTFSRSASPLGRPPLSPRFGPASPSAFSIASPAGQCGGGSPRTPSIPAQHRPPVDPCASPPPAAGSPGAVGEVSAADAAWLRTAGVLTEAGALRATWAAAIEGDLASLCGAEELEERVQWFWGGGWWTSDAGRLDYFVKGASAVGLRHLREPLQAARRGWLGEGTAVSEKSGLRDVLAEPWKGLVDAFYGGEAARERCFSDLAPGVYQGAEDERVAAADGREAWFRDHWWMRAGYRRQFRDSAGDGEANNWARTAPDEWNPAEVAPFAEQKRRIQWYRQNPLPAGLDPDVPLPGDCPAASSLQKQAGDDSSHVLSSTAKSTSYALASLHSTTASSPHDPTGSDSDEVGAWWQEPWCVEEYHHWLEAEAQEENHCSRPFWYHKLATSCVEPSFDENRIAVADYAGGTVKPQGASLFASEEEMTKRKEWYRENWWWRSACVEDYLERKESASGWTAQASPAVLSCWWQRAAVTQGALNDIALGSSTGGGASQDLPQEALIEAELDWVFFRSPRARMPAPLSSLAARAYEPSNGQDPPLRPAPVFHPIRAIEPSDGLSQPCHRWISFCPRCPALPPTSDPNLCACRKCDTLYLCSRAELAVRTRWYLEYSKRKTLGAGRSTGEGSDDWSPEVKKAALTHRAKQYSLYGLPADEKRRRVDW